MGWKGGCLTPCAITRTLFNLHFYLNVSSTHRQDEASIQWTNLPIHSTSMFKKHYHLFCNICAMYLFINILTNDVYIVDENGKDWWLKGKRVWSLFPNFLLPPPVSKGKGGDKGMNHVQTSNHPSTQDGERPQDINLGSQHGTHWGDWGGGFESS